MADNIKWHLVTIDPGVETSGEMICILIQLLTKVISYQFVITDYIDGSPKKGNNGLIFNLQNQAHLILNLEDLLKMLSNVEQLQWGDFFLFEEPPCNWLGEEDILYPPLIAQTDTTVRAVDGTYVYIYTPYETMVEVLKKNYEIESITIDFLENLPYPD